MCWSYPENNEIKDSLILKREIIITSDGSTTIQIPQWDEQYHSKFGAIQESYHVFIKNGLDLFETGSEISILEIGFGTGLNCFITFLEGRNNDLKIDYTGVEAYPVKQDEVDRLNYVVELKAISDRKIFNDMHLFSWNKRHALSTSFVLFKKKEFFENIKDTNKYNLIYFDAFGAQVQPELWTVGIFKKMYQALKQKGILVTYSSKGSVRRAMQEAGFEVERLPGPPGKRHMLCAAKY